MEVILLKTGKEYMDEWREAVKDCKPGGQMVYPSSWILYKWEEDNGFQGPWQEEEIKSWRDTILRDPVLADHLTHNGAAQAHDLNRGLAAPPPSYFIFVYCLYIYIVV